MITVKNLIEELQDMPQDAPILLGWTPLRDIYIDENFYFADSKNPKTAIGTAVILE